MEIVKITLIFKGNTLFSIEVQNDNKTITEAIKSIKNDIEIIVSEPKIKENGKTN